LWVRKIGATLGQIGASGGRSKVTGVESTKQAKRTPAAKFQQLYSYLESEEILCYFEFMNDEQWDTIKKDSMLDCIVSPRFSKLDEMLSMVNQFSSLTSALEEATGESLLDDKGFEAMKGLTALGQTQQAKGIACVCSFTNSAKFQLISYLNPSYLKVPKEQIVGDVTLFCKVQRVLSKGEKMELVEFFPELSNFILNREQKRKIKKDVTAPPEIKDTVRGPAAVVIPIAIYR